jgi:tetratricopeptide (TPR) repeat protein
VALTYEGMGEIEKAGKEYERIGALTTGRLGYGDNYVKSFYNLGRLRERQGDRIRAAENYEKFLELWKDADPGLPEIEDARKRLAGLKGN